MVVQSTSLFYIDSLRFEINSLFYGLGFVRPRTLFDSNESMFHGQIYIKQIMPRKGAGVGGKVHKVLPTKKATQKGCFLLVGLSGLEPPTPTLSGWCSNQLSYSPICLF